MIVKSIYLVYSLFCLEECQGWMKMDNNSSVVNLLRRHHQLFFKVQAWKLAIILSLKPLNISGCKVLESFHRAYLHESY